MKQLLYIIVFVPSLVFAQQGPYSPDAGDPNTDAIKHNSYTILDWAWSCTVERGFMDVSDTTLGVTTVGVPANATGQANGSVISLGDGGVATLTFSTPIQNTLGADIAVFENSFSHNFLELAHVEISSDGVNFFRFPSVSLTQTDTQTAAFGETDPTNIYNLAGKYKGLFGTPFDFEELDSIPGLNIDSVSYVRVIDVVGSIDTNYASYDSQGNIINDPWPTDFGNGGFDLDGVAALGDVTSIKELKQESTSFYPNPVQNLIYLTSENQDVNVYSISGALMHSETNSTTVDVSGLDTGIYFIELGSNSERTIQRFVKL